MSVLPGSPAIEPPTGQVDELVADPEDIDKMIQDDKHTGVRQRLWGFQARLDPSVTLEEYMHWADVEREMEEEEFRHYKGIDTVGGGLVASLKNFFGRERSNDTQTIYGNAPTVPHSEKRLPLEKDTNSSDIESPVRPAAPSASHEFDAEWRTAVRALRTASWGGVFYLITTDILGWSQTPYVLANTGYGLGVGMFVLMGLAAAASGWMIWKTFLALDSSRFPVLSFGDPFFRLFGPRARHAINFAQGLQMFLSVCVLQLGQTNVVAQLGESANLCFIVCGIIALVVGMASGYLRSLKHLSWLSNAAVWLNVATFIIVCVAAAKYGPDPVPQVNGGILPKSWAKNPAPVKTFIGVPPARYQPTDTDLFAAEFNGINSIVYAYSGAVLFIAFMAEMRHPMDFWKAVFCAQFFICVVYSFFGAFAYTYYGQYSYSLVNQVVQPLGLQIAGNVLTLITGWLAIFLYFNVGLKMVYLEIGQELLHLPPITTTKGKYIWWIIGPIYWILAFVVAMSVPQFNAFTNFVGGLFSLNFTYSFAGMMFTALKVQQYGKLPGEGFDPATGVTTRHDGGPKRWMRGFMKGWKFTVPALIYTCAGLAASGMGTWAAILALQAAFGPGGSVVTSWTCTNPFYTG
ncbi:hypothetical protein M409DRAFT_18445 [Zasmidium cellare ATCC 36951]|uniref:Amino acid transporter transmembrane domain-containing protein n=1 Tax=Zasmidium cellare ATCC 36951 TaxID=1080233 RepID=A0A6A6CYQ8_ZASCE|nr:uncharacterized protein M409DRAFT_18445 [Zasmidium cellare ATCC 36951]KAF2171330.1 hypothetical protein M409DRAFT_18445 [Zasmidium cellare ATCC 36951]